jgi:hypothetical protein
MGQRYYALMDLSFIPIKMNPDHMRNNSLTVFWVRLSFINTKIKRAALIVLSNDGTIVKSVWPTKSKTISSVILNVFERTSLDGDDWNWDELLKISLARKRMIQYYGSRESYRRRIALLPVTQNSLHNIC